MGDLFRSEEMSLTQLFIQPEAAYFVVSALGESGTVQFRDLNENLNTYQRKFINEVRRCDEMERKLRYIEAEVKKDNIPISDQTDLPKAPNPREIIDLEAHLDKTENDIKELSESAVQLKTNFLELTELKHVLEKIHFFLDHVDDEGDSMQRALIGEDQNAGKRGQLSSVAGVINRERVPGFERMLWRISRGNVFFRQVEIETPLEDPVTGIELKKVAFVAFYQGDQLDVKVRKVCAGYHVSVYNCPNAGQERSEMLKNVSTQLEDLKIVLNQTLDHRQRVLISVARELQNWSVMVCKMKAIYHTLNFLNMDVSKKCLIGEGWVPTNDIPKVQKALSDGSVACGSSIPSFLNVINTNEEPPTYNRTNKFTRGFQNLIESYGVASYREANPALYTIITFPFLFAVMFGDVGHALIMLCFGGYMVLAEKKLQAIKSNNEIFNIFFAGRYIVLLMGVFSVYTGFVYNDFFSKSMNIFTSSWEININSEQADYEDQWDLDPTYDYKGTSYFIGMDPIWQLARNKIIFLNSYKMKLSIIFGVVHMIFGVCVSVVNFVHFRKYSSIFLEFLPQVLLLIFLFLWMVIMMFMKWIMYTSDKSQPTEFGSSCAPLILIYFINMMLFKGAEPKVGCNDYMFDGQESLQRALIFLALICIPVILLGKPLYIIFTRSKARKIHANGVEEIEGGHQKPSSHEEEEPMSEIFIHQGIHTIEYVLSTISHTASYLRLWALSLAHAQLSEVLWTMIFSIGLKRSSYVGGATTFLLFAPWAFFTVAILVLMEGLSAFLHTLRLHWVEFMSKFYSGLGYAFEPFSFEAILEAANAED